MMRSRKWRRGKSATRKSWHTCSRRTSSSMPCVDGRRRGRACASICSTFPTSCARRPEHLLELVRGRDLELIVATLLWRLVGTPPQEHRGMAEAVALQMVVLHFADAFDAKRLPR